MARPVSKKSAPVAGIDGCRGGWIIAIHPGANEAIDWRVAATAAEAARLTSHCAVVAIDIPIGLPEVAAPGGRGCDREARALLPPGWKSSVFSPPCRAVLRAASYEEGLAIQRASSPEAPGFSVQAWNIIPKIREVDDLLAGEGELPWYETFPELAFIEANEQKPLQSKKKTEAGRLERRLILTRIFGAIHPSPEGLYPRNVVQVDDFYDALICCHVARRILLGEARVLTVENDPPVKNRTSAIHF